MSLLGANNSRKIFVGGLPPDITEGNWFVYKGTWNNLCTHFSFYNNLKIKEHKYQMTHQS